MVKLSTGAFVAAGLIAVGLSAPAHASVVYDLSFDNNAGTVIEGTGSLTLNFSALSQAYNLNESLAPILVNITTANIDGNGSFTITPANLAAGSQFQTGNVGQIYTLTAEEAGSGSSTELFLDLFTHTWQLHNGNDNGATADSGELVVTGPTLTATPAPATFPLLAGGLGLLGYLAARRKRQSPSRALATA